MSSAEKASLPVLSSASLDHQSPFAVSSLNLVFLLEITVM
jgi:hypothetical protein